MNSAIGLNLPTPSVDASQTIAVSKVASSPASVAVSPVSEVAGAVSVSASCSDGECLKQGDGGFLEVLNAELEALVENESSDLLALASVGELENIDEVEELTELDIANVVLVDVQQGDSPIELIGLNAAVESVIGVSSVADEIESPLVLEFKHALLELPDNVTALPLTPENKVFIMQQAMALVEQKHPDMIAKLQQANGQELPLEGKLLPIVDAVLMAQDTIKPIQVAALSASVMAQNLSAKELTSEAGSKIPLADMLETELDSDTELSIKNATALTEPKSDVLKEKQLLENMLNKNAAQADAPTQKLTAEAVSTTSLNNVLNVNQTSITNSTTAVIQPGNTLLLPQKPSAEQWGNALGDKLQWMINTKLETAEIRIDPPHLGKMNISIKMTDDGASVVIQTQLAVTRDLVDAASYRLKEMLEDAGYNQVDVDVSHQENNQTDSQFADNEESNGSGLAANQDAEDMQSASAEDVIAGTFINERGGLDLFV